MFLLLQGSIPIQMGGFGTILMIVLSILLAVLNCYQWMKSSEATHWKGSSQAYESELVIVRQRCERLEGENKSQAQEIAVLRSRTDLESLRSQGAATEQLIVTQGKQLQQGHEAILVGMQQFAKTLGEMQERFLARDEEYAVLIRAQSDTIKSLQSQLNLKAEMPV